MILAAILSEVVESPYDLVSFFLEQGLRKNSSILHANPTSDHVSTCYYHLSIAWRDKKMEDYLRFLKVNAVVIL